MAAVTDINALTEDCIAHILSFTTPKDACRSSLVDLTFRSAAESDVAWEKFLPSDYLEIISLSVGDFELQPEFPSKKDLYLHLADHPILIDSGSKSFNLDKSSGKKCYMLSARCLEIFLGFAPEYWQWKSHPNSRFPEVAELLHGEVFEIRGYINSNMLPSVTNYAAYLVFTTDSVMWGFDHLHAEVSVGIKGLERAKHSVYLERDIDTDTEFLKRRGDGWMEVELGEYFVMRGADDDIEMRLRGTELSWKKGIVIQGIEIRPKE